MGKNRLKSDFTSPYQGCSILLTTKHQKSKALAPPFDDTLGAKVRDYVVDTDLLGTFSGEVAREDGMIETAKKKCEWALDSATSEYALASEGSFGPHPTMPFLPSNQETLYFIDKARDFHLYVSDISSNTNYQMSKVSSLEELMLFSKAALFPSHALILRPFPENTTNPILKGIQNINDLQTAFLEFKKRSSDNAVWVETDMRAHLNPTRMSRIRELGEKLVHRLVRECPNCMTPGWGAIDIETGLPCGWCAQPTTQIKAEILGCTKCEHRENNLYPKSQEKADPQYCVYCNP